MAPPLAAADAFTAIAEPGRREVLSAIARAGGERDVTWIVKLLGRPQPQVSKHLAVLREAGLVSVRSRGRRRVYSVNGPQLRPVFEWVKEYERFWDHQLHRIKERAERAAAKAQNRPPQAKQ